MPYACTRTHVKKISLPGGIVVSHIVDQKFRKHFEFETLLLAHVLHATRMHLINPIVTDGWDTLPSINIRKQTFPIFPSPLSWLSIMHRDACLKCHAWACRQRNPSGTTSPSENWSTPSVVHRCEHHENLMGHIHRKRTTPATGTYLARSRARPPTSSYSPSHPFSR